MFIHQHFSANSIPIKEFPFTRELSMEAYIWDNEGILTIENYSQDIIIIQNQVKLIDGGDDRDGRIDLLARYGQERLAIVELKLGDLRNSCYDQLKNYLNVKAQVIEKVDNAWDKSMGEPKWLGIMIGNRIDNELIQNLEKCNYLYGDIPIVAMTMRRYRSEDGCIYVITDTYCSPNTGRDYSKYIFKNDTYGKSRLVHAVVKDYANSHPNICFDELYGKFPKKLQGSWGVIRRYDDVMDTVANPAARFYIKPDELIELKDGNTIVVCNNWGRNSNGKDNIETFIKHCNDELHYVIKK
jgi:hypothetical protein